ncbi:MAG: PIN domain-containing protein [Burkholderiaceae bacterium]|nr:PIN domain-containing protein [Burkholderiaceae bacterium]
MGRNKGMSVLDLCHKIPKMSSERLIIDTNVLLDLFVFADERVLALREAIEGKRAQLFYSSAMLEEFKDVLGRAQFGLGEEVQSSILRNWQDLGTLLSIEQSAPIRCSDPDDQIFIDLAYQLRPSLLFSKDLALINLRGKLHGLEIELRTY